MLQWSTLRRGIYPCVAALCVSITLAACGSSTQSSKQAPSSHTTSIVIGSQPASWGVEFYIASQRNWWRRVGLNVKIDYFGTGAPEIAAGASGAWQLAGSGIVPDLSGAEQYGLESVLLEDQEAEGNVLIATKQAAAQIQRNPSVFKGMTIPFPENSSGEWAAQECLAKHYHLTPSEWTPLNLAPPDINSAMEAGRYQVAGTFQPFSFELESAIGARVICTLKTVNVAITSNIVVPPAYAKAHPNIVAKVLATYERGVEFGQKHPQAFKNYMSSFFTSVGTPLTASEVVQQIATRPQFPVAQELRLFKGGANSTAVRWTNEAKSFVLSRHILSAVPPAPSFVTGKYLELVATNPTLLAFAEDK